jgi:L-aspartate oxidase
MRAVLSDEYPRLALPATEPREGETVDTEKTRDMLQRVMTAHAGVLRSATSLSEAGDVVQRLLAELRGDGPDICEVRNLAVVAQALLLAAAVREESRGAHNRTDFLDTSDEYRHHLVIA